MDLTKEQFSIIAKAFFIALPQINAITISNSFFGKKNSHFFTLWKDNNFTRELNPETNERWQYISTIKENNIINHIKFSNFDFYLKTKGVYVFRRDEFQIPAQPYKILNQSMFLLKFGLFFAAFPNILEIYYRTGSKLILKGSEVNIELEFESGFVIRGGNQSFHLYKSEWLTMGSLITAYKKHKEVDGTVQLPLFDFDFSF